MLQCFLLLSSLAFTLLLSQTVDFCHNTTLCDDTVIKCNCCYAKNYTEQLNITCMEQNCNWYHNICSTSELIKENSGFLVLEGNFNPNSYGNFIATQPNNLCYYLIVPTEGYCDNCTEIIIDGISRQNNETVYKNVGDDVKIIANISICHAQEPVVLKLNGSSKYPNNCSPNGSSYDCTNLTTENTGVYVIHATLDDTLGNPYWCSNNVTIIVQCLPRIYGITIVDQCVSDFAVQWASADFDPACGNISYDVTLTGKVPLLNDESNKENFNVTEKYMNFTGLNNEREYFVRVRSVSMEGYGDTVNHTVHTVNSSSARPSMPLNVAATNVSMRSITVSWESAENLYCGNILYYACNLYLIHNNTITERIHTIFLNYTFENLSPGMTYNISVAAVNRAAVGDAAVVNVTTLHKPNNATGSQSSGLMACAVTVSITVIISLWGQLQLQ